MIDFKLTLELPGDFDKRITVKVGNLDLMDMTVGAYYLRSIANGQTFSETIMRQLEKWSDAHCPDCHH